MSGTRVVMTSTWPPAGQAESDGMVVVVEVVVGVVVEVVAVGAALLVVDELDVVVGGAEVEVVVVDVLLVELVVVAMVLLLVDELDVVVGGAEVEVVVVLGAVEVVDVLPVEVVVVVLDGAVVEVVVVLEVVDAADVLVVVDDVVDVETVLLVVEDVELVVVVLGWVSRPASLIRPAMTWPATNLPVRVAPSVTCSVPSRAQTRALTSAAREIEKREPRVRMSRSSAGPRRDLGPICTSLATKTWAAETASSTEPRRVRRLQNT
jgi:hypothetical protein